ncbi:uncharacterized protein LOC127878180 [Dreissena polymorpha]|uniref:uncharacterized protein LOC127878180 n=1 Tax=Dreissena polymorpha TaxID=45954 RepID=UPI0022645354|nr:uncharacterized protein LOC127878180 [Dreissena polymorpha]
MSMCSIDGGVVAVALYNSEIHFIRVTKAGRQVQERKLKLEHDCRSIAHNQGFLYITSGMALHQYTVCGRLVSTIHVDKSLRATGEACVFNPYESAEERVRLAAGIDNYYHYHRSVNSCVVSPDGTNLYVFHGYKLITLSRDGTVINKLAFYPESEDMYWYSIVYFNTVRPANFLHITDSGQVLVCRALSNGICQVDSGGRQIRADVVTEDMVRSPLSVFYSKHRAALIVGVLDSDYIMVFKT